LEVPPLLVKGIVGGISCSARSQLLAGNEKELPRLADELLEWTLSFLNETVVELAELDLLATRKSASEPTGADEPHIHGNAGAPEGERELILSAVAKLAFADGYCRLTVPRICAAAGIRRKGFETHFENVTDCFLATLKLRTFRAIEYAATEAASGSSWPEGVNRATTALCQQIVRDPVFAKLAFIEAFAAGEEGVLCREGIMAAIVERFRAGAPRDQRPTRLAAETSVGAVWGLLHHYVISGRAQQLPGLAPTLSFLALAPTIGAPAAAEAIRREMAT
ncbi:MAG TPA: TetR/AcrR family transcriptional regulator, partial [Solirubrobacterales bacterium]